MTPLDAFSAALAQAANEPDDKVAIPLSVGPDAEFMGLTWGDLRAVAEQIEGDVGGFRLLADALAEVREIRAALLALYCEARIATPTIAGRRETALDAAIQRAAVALGVTT